MSTKVIDYTLDTLTPANPDASCPATVTGCVVVPGPGPTTLGTYAKALDLSGGGALVAALPVAQLDSRKFAVRLVFKIDTVVTVAQTLVESDAIPLTVSLVPGSGTSDFHVVATVTTSNYGAGRASTQYLTDLHLGVWYAADLVYDTDTLAVFIDDVISSVHAFPDGTMAAGTGDKLFIGRSGTGTNQFEGSIAALELHADIPIALEAQLDEFRSHPQWFLTYKQEEIKYTLAFGEPTNEFYFDFPSGAWIQPFAGGIVMYHDANGQAFAMHGAILQTYWALPTRAAIGYLVSDELGGAQGGSRKSLFNRGGIYWSPGTGAIPVIGQIWVDYEGMGESGAIGLPTAAAESIGGGARQVFQRAQMYWRSGSAKAFMVTGAILAKFLATGGTPVWGFPVSSENDVISGSTAIGRISEFQKCTIYWSSMSGAAVVVGDIRDRFRSVGGPAGRLGFPTSDESDVPAAAAPARINSFQHGTIAWFGSAAETYVCEAFDIVLGTVDTMESEGWLRGENDLYMWATIADNGFVLHSERLPGSGDHGGHNIWPINKRFDLGPNGIIPNDINRTITFDLDVWDSDWPDGDDHLGVFHAELSAANAWGLRGNPLGLQNSGKFDNINNISWAVAPRVDVAALPAAKKWWGVQNKGTDPITYQQYATAFRDVDSSTEWWDITDWLAKLFYELVVKDVAKGGNCFGMSLEAIYSKKDRSLLTEPIDRFNVWPPVVNEFNIKHQYQVGASAIWWFVGEFLSGQTHDPVSVFRATRNAFHAGCDPVICIAQNYDFSGAPHCILPVGWDDTVTPWEIKIRDPNFPTTNDMSPPQVLYVDPVANTFHYQGAGNVYDGGAWTGGRFHYVPFDLVNDRPRTPIYDAIMLLLSGVILIVGSDSQTTTLTDENGIDLDAFGSDAVGRLQAGRSLANKFVSVKGFYDAPSMAAGRYDYVRDCPPERTGPKPVEPTHDRPERPERPRPHGALPGELHMRSAPKRYSRVAPPNKRGGDDWTRLTLDEYLCQVAPAPVRELFAKQPDYVAQNERRLMMHLTDSAVMREIMAAAGTTVPPVVDYPAISNNFIHHTRVVRGGRFEYALKQGLSQMVVTADAAAGEVHTIKVTDLGSHNNVLTLTGYRDKVFGLQVHNRLGVGNDYLRMAVDNIPLTAGGDLELNVKPGIGGIELVSAGQVIRSTVSFEYLQRGVRLSSRFALDGQDGLRLVPSTFITDNHLKVSRITNLFGQSVSSDIVQALP